MLARPIAIRTTAAHERVLVEGMAQFYIDDFATLEPPESSNIIFNSEGRYNAIPDFEAYWSGEPGRHVFLIEAYGAPAGFALLNSFSHLTGAPIQHNMGEFFVARKYRRHGVATAAFHLVVARFPGRWEVAVATRNGPAQAFWAGAIASAPGVHDIVRHSCNNELWRGPIFCFSIV